MSNRRRAIVLSNVNLRRSWVAYVFFWGLNPERCEIDAGSSTHSFVKVGFAIVTIIGGNKHKVPSTPLGMTNWWAGRLRNIPPVTYHQKFRTRHHAKQEVKKLGQPGSLRPESTAS